MVAIGERSVPLNGFREVPIRTLSQLQYESPTDSELRQWVQCAECRSWQVRVRLRVRVRVRVR